MPSPVLWGVSTISFPSPWLGALWVVTSREAQKLQSILSLADSAWVVSYSLHVSLFLGLQYSYPLDGVEVVCVFN